MRNTDMSGDRARIKNKHTAPFFCPYTLNTPPMSGAKQERKEITFYLGH